MTNNEAIELLKSLTEYSVDRNGIGTFPMVSTSLQVEALDLAIKSLENERPQGEWFVNPHSMIMKCMNCGHEETAKDVGVVDKDKHFCYWCGADMRKGGTK